MRTIPLTKEGHDRWLESFARLGKALEEFGAAMSKACVRAEALDYATYEWPDMVIEDLLDAEFIGDVNEWA